MNWIWFIIIILKLKSVLIIVKKCVTKLVFLFLIRMYSLEDFIIKYYYPYYFLIYNSPPL